MAKYSFDYKKIVQAYLDGNGSSGFFHIYKINI